MEAVEFYRSDWHERLITATLPLLLHAYEPSGMMNIGHERHPSSPMVLPSTRQFSDARHDGVAMSEPAATAETTCWC